MSAKVGRPSKGGDHKKYPRTVSSTKDIEDFLGKNPQINASEIWRSAMRIKMYTYQENNRRKALCVVKKVEETVKEEEF
jgi:hypothetical protein